MKLVDVTLRDGGFVNDFNWNIQKAKLHIDTMESIGVHVIELGYWKQSSKSKNPYYNMNEDLLDKLTRNTKPNTKIAVMIDFHYCSKEISDYPNIGESKLELVRITSRKEDFEDALEFASKLRIATGLKVSFQIINSTNYSQIELLEIAKKLSGSNIDIVAFADSHGNLNLVKDFDKYIPAIELFKKSNIKWGFHLHNHTGRANLNYWLLKSQNCDYIDASVKGLGKGGGNLKMEEVVSNESLPLLLNYMAGDCAIEMNLSKYDCFNILCGRENVTDNYRRQGVEHDIDFVEFQSIISRLEGEDKDTYNPKAFEIWVK